MTIKEQITSGDKAIVACRAYVAAIGRIKTLTGQIGAALLKCRGTGEFDADTEGEPMPRTHLRDFYRYFGQKERAAFLACSHCVLADKLVQDRKVARQSLGAAKRQISKIGKSA